MSIKSEDLMQKNMIWKKHPNHVKFYYLKHDDIYIYLRLNNFPDEPLFTLINEFDIIDIEDRPRMWLIEGW